MAHFLCQGNYTASAMKALVQRPQDREAAVKPMFEAAGGRVLGFYFGLGDSDWYVISELPDVTAAGALAMAVAASPTLANVKTTVLLTPAEAMQAMSKAQGMQFPAATT